MGSITSWLRTLSGPGVYAAVALLVFAEDALFVGFVLPGETAAVLGGVIAGTSHSVEIALLVPIVVLAAIIGDSTGYEIGRRFGPRLLQTRPARRHADRIESARSLIQRRGPAAVFLGRFVSFLRAMVPTLAGVSELPYLRFLAYNAAGGLVWGTGYTLLGYLAGNAYQRVEKIAGTVAAIVVGVLVALAVGVWAVRRHRAEAKQAEELRAQEPEEEPAGEEPSEEGPTGAPGAGSGERPPGATQERADQAVGGEPLPEHQPAPDPPPHGGPAREEREEQEPGAAASDDGAPPRGAPSSASDCPPGAGRYRSEA
jgi:membrane-associated protein